MSDALARLPVEVEPISLPVPHAPGLTAFGEDTYDARLEGAARIYPHHLDSGGLFLAKLRKLDEGASTSPHEKIQDYHGGWSSVPVVFPGDDLARDEAERLLADGLAEIEERQGVTRRLHDSRWCFRGGRAWMHSIEEWPLEAWADGRWRPISIGVRAIDFDSRGRPRASNDLLRWLDSDITRRVIDVSPDELEDLLNRAAVPSSVEERGPVALRYRGDVVGRGAVTVDGLKSEIPKARASDLLRILQRETEG